MHAFPIFCEITLSSPFLMPASPPPLKGISFILKLPFWFGSILKIYIKGPNQTIWLRGPCFHLFPECGRVSGSSLLSCIPIGRPAPGIRGSVFSPCGEDLHIPTSWNHIILMRMQMKGTLWEMALDELLVKNVLLGRGTAEGRVSRAPSFAEWRFLGDLRWVAHGQVWRKHIFIDVPIVTGSYSWYLNNSCRFWQLFPFRIYMRLFILVKFPKTRSPGRLGEKSGQGRLGCGISWISQSLGPGRHAENICRWDTIKSHGPWLVCWVNKPLFTEKWRQRGRTARGVSLGQLCTPNSLITS